MSQKEKQIEYCERCLNYNTVSRMNKIKLEPLEVKKKCFDKRIYAFIYTFFDYFECPICHWYKFKQKEV